MGSGLVGFKELLLFCLHTGLIEISKQQIYIAKILTKISRNIILIPQTGKNIGISSTMVQTHLVLVLVRKSQISEEIYKNKYSYQY